MFYGFKKKRKKKMVYTEDGKNIAVFISNFNNIERKQSFAYPHKYVLNKRTLLFFKQEYQSDF